MQPLNNANERGSGCGGACFWRFEIIEAALSSMEAQCMVVALALLRPCIAHDGIASIVLHNNSEKQTRSRRFV